MRPSVRTLKCVNPGKTSFFLFNIAPDARRGVGSYIFGAAVIIVGARFQRKFHGSNGVDALRNDARKLNRLRSSCYLRTNNRPGSLTFPAWEADFNVKPVRENVP